jgi:hypothetical protein
VVNNGTLEVLGSGSGIEIWANSADPVSNVNIVNNILINNFGYGIKGSYAGMSDIFVSDNLIFENTGGITAYIQEAKKTKTENPLFSNDSSSYTNSSDFRLQSTSPAIDAGANVGLTADFEGTPVPQGAAPDIGAFEYHSGTLTYRPADLNQDTNINVTDLGILMSDFMKSAASAQNSRSDINTDGNVNVVDLGILMSEWE